MTRLDIDAAILDPTGEGAQARARRRGRDACPYGLDTEEREEWLEGYDGRERTGGA